MIVRRYTGKSVEKVHEVIQKELGPNAVVVSVQKRRETGLVPGVGKTVYEVTAVAEDQSADADAARPATTAAAAGTAEWLDWQKQQYRGLRQSMRLMDEKLVEMDQTMGRLTRTAAPAADGDGDGGGVLQHVHPAWRPALQAEAVALAGSTTPATAHCLEALARRLPSRAGLEFHAGAGGPEVYVLVGPTGVGKTTTLAKLAAKAVLGRKLKTALVTMDTFRVAGVDQLREYANLLGVELGVAFSATEFRRHLTHFRDCDAVFVDTPGRSPNDEAGLAEIRAGLGDAARFHVVLAVPANLHRDDVPNLLRAYLPFTPDAIIVTKVDEASNCSGLTMLLDAAHAPVCYVTNGQRVPEDIVDASSRQLAALILLPGGGSAIVETPMAPAAAFTAAPTAHPPESRAARPPAAARPSVPATPSSPGPRLRAVGDAQAHPAVDDIEIAYPYDAESPAPAAAAPGPAAEPAPTGAEDDQDDEYQGLLTLLRQKFGPTDKKIP